MHLLKYQVQLNLPTKSVDTEAFLEVELDCTGLKVIVLDDGFDTILVNKKTSPTFKSSLRCLYYSLTLY